VNITLFLSCTAVVVHSPQRWCGLRSRQETTKLFHSLNSAYTNAFRAKTLLRLRSYPRLRHTTCVGIMRTHSPILNFLKGDIANERYCCDLQVGKASIQGRSSLLLCNWALIKSCSYGICNNTKTTCDVVYCSINNPRRHTVQTYASAAKPALASLLISNWECAVRGKLFADIRFDFLLYCYTIMHWALNLKTFSAMPIHVMNICAKFHSNP